MTDNFPFKIVKAMVFIDKVFENVWISERKESFIPCVTLKCVYEIPIETVTYK